MLDLESLKRDTWIELFGLDSRAVWLNLELKLGNKDALVASSRQSVGMSSLSVSFFMDWSLVFIGKGGGLLLETPYLTSLDLGNNIDLKGDLSP